MPFVCNHIADLNVSALNGELLYTFVTGKDAKKKRDGKIIGNVTIIVRSEVTDGL